MKGSCLLTNEGDGQAPHGQRHDGADPVDLPPPTFSGGLQGPGSHSVIPMLQCNAGSHSIEMTELFWDAGLGQDSSI